MAAVHPLLELVAGNAGDIAKAGPAFLIVRQVRVTRFLLAVEAVHHLVLVKRAVLVHLVNDIDHAVPAIQVIGQEHVDMVAVNAFGATDVAVGVVHFLAPRLAAGVNATANTALRLLYGDVKAVDLDMALLVVAGFLLAVGGLGVHLGLGLGYCCIACSSRFSLLASFLISAGLFSCGCGCCFALACGLLDFSFEFILARLVDEVNSLFKYLLGRLDGTTEQIHLPRCRIGRVSIVQS